jgi:hypothetical protein
MWVLLQKEIRISRENLSLRQKAKEIWSCKNHKSKKIINNNISSSNSKEELEIKIDSITIGL